MDSYYYISNDNSVRIRPLNIHCLYSDFLRILKILNRKKLIVLRQFTTDNCILKFELGFSIQLQPKFLNIFCIRT